MGDNPTGSDADEADGVCGRSGRGQSFHHLFSAADRRRVPDAAGPARADGGRLRGGRAVLPADPPAGAPGGPFRRRQAADVGRHRRAGVRVRRRPAPDPGRGGVFRRFSLFSAPLAGWIFVPGATSSLLIGFERFLRAC